MNTVEKDFFDKQDNETNIISQANFMNFCYATYKTKYDSIELNHNNTLLAMYSYNIQGFDIYNYKTKKIQHFHLKDDPIFGVSFVNDQIFIFYEFEFFKYKIIFKEIVNYLDKKEDSILKENNFSLKRPYRLPDDPIQKPVEIEIEDFIELKLIGFENDPIDSPYCCFEMENDYYLYFWHEAYNIGKNSKCSKKPYSKFSIIADNCIAVYKEKELEIYKRREGLVYSESYNKICNYSFIENSINPAYYNVRGNKIYKLFNGRIVGHDLNICVSKLDNFKPDKFQNIDRLVLLYEKKSYKLRIYTKCLESILLEGIAEDFLCFGDDLYLISSGYFYICKIPNKYTQPLLLLNKSLEYMEEECELDWSDYEYYDFVTKEPPQDF